MLNSKDLSFVGYTYKNFEAVKGLHQSAGLLHIVANKCLVKCTAVELHGFLFMPMSLWPLLVSFLTCEPCTHADLQRSSSFTRHSVGSSSGRVFHSVASVSKLHIIHWSVLYLWILTLPDTADMDSSMEPDGTDTHMRSGSSGDPMVPWSPLQFPEAPCPTPASVPLDDVAASEETWLLLFRSHALLIVGEHVLLYKLEVSLQCVSSENREGQCFLTLVAQVGIVLDCCLPCGSSWPVLTYKWRGGKLC